MVASTVGYSINNQVVRNKPYIHFFTVSHHFIYFDGISF